MEKLMKGMGKGKMPDLGALAGGDMSAQAAAGSPVRKATKSNKRKKRSKSRR
jgi:hypothetical protein